jgi:FixJ family two-component response regulator
MLGKEVAERLQATLPDLRTLFMSGYAQQVLSSRGTLQDDVRLLEKPFTESELLLAVRDLIERP